MSKIYSYSWHVKEQRRSNLNKTTSFYGWISQWAEETASKAVQCGFDSLFTYHRAFIARMRIINKCIARHLEARDCCSVQCNFCLRETRVGKLYGAPNVNGGTAWSSANLFADIYRYHERKLIPVAGINAAVADKNCKVVSRCIMNRVANYMMLAWWLVYRCQLNRTRTTV